MWTLTLAVWADFSFFRFLVGVAASPRSQCEPLTGVGEAGD